MDRPVPAPHQIYRHFKGKIYQVICVAEHSETGEKMVVYQALYGEYAFWVRPLEMFMEKVDRSKYPDADQVYRFEPVMNDGRTEKEASVSLPASDDSAAPAQAVGQADNVKTDEKSEKDSAAEAYGRENTDSDAEVYDESQTDPDVIRFWDADTYAERVEILDAMKYKITNDMIDIMSTVIDIEINKNEDVQARFAAFRDALMIRRTYETSRLR